VLRTRESSQNSPVELTPDALDDLIEVGVTDLFISSHNGLWVGRYGAVTQRHTSFAESDVRRLAVQLIGLGGRHVDDAQPWADVALPSGIRVHVMLAPVSVSGTEISIRVPRAVPFSLDELVASGMMSHGQAAYLRACIAQRATLVVTGATGSGKTTLAAALMALVPDRERILTIEDVAELHITHPRVVRLETRQANIEGRGRIDISDLIRQALRMRPDRLVLGECRGAELLDTLMAFNTGHEGGATTVHANSLEDVPARLLAMLSTAGLTDEASITVVLAAISRVVHIESHEGARHITIGRPIRRVDSQGRSALTIDEISVPSG